MAAFIPLIIMACRAATNIAAGMLSTKEKNGLAKPLDSLLVTSSTYGSPINIGFGTMRVGGQIIFGKDLVQHRHKSYAGKGGPGVGFVSIFAPVTTQTSYTYSWTGGVGICSTEFTGPISHILKIWADSKLVYDATGQSGVSTSTPGNGGGKGGGSSGVVNGSVGNAYNDIGVFRVYTGTQTQMPDPAYEDYVGAANASAHRGMAYIVFDDINLANYGNRVPNWTFEVAFGETSMAQTSIPFTFSSGSVDDDNCAIDALRHRAYFVKSGHSSDASASIHAIDLKTGVEVLYSSVSRTTAGNPNRNYTAKGMVVANDGYLYVYSQEATYGVYCKVDPDTLMEVGHIGTPGYSSVGGSLTTPHYVVPVTISHKDMLFVAGSGGGDLHLLDLTTLTEAASLYVGQEMRLCGGSQVSADAVTAFGTLVGDWVTTIPFYKFDITATSITRTLLSTIHPHDLNSTWPSFRRFGNLVLDATDGNLLMGADTHDEGAGQPNAYVIKLSATTGGVIWQSAVNLIPGYDGDYGAYQSVVTSGTFSFIGIDDMVYVISTQDGQRISAHKWNRANANYQAWVDSFGAILIHGNTTFEGWGVIVTNMAASGVPCSGIVQAICGVAGLAPEDIDVTGITNSVGGYVITGQTTARDAISPLATAFMFDAAESDYKLKFVARGSSYIATIPADDLAVVDNQTHAVIVETRTQEIDIPSQISVRFLDPNRDYQVSTQYARRSAVPVSTMHSKSIRTEDFPIVATPEEMRRVAEKLIYSQWMGRTTYRIKTSWKYAKYDPTDVMRVALTDGSYSVTRLVGMTMGADMTIENDCIAENGITYQSIATTDGGLGFHELSMLPNATTKLYLMDLPVLRDTDDPGQNTAIIHIAAVGYTTPWSGAEVFYSYDDTLYSDAFSIPAAKAAISGYTTTKLGDTDSPYTLDRDNTLTVVMTNGADQLSSATMTQVCNGLNVAAVINSSGAIEVIQFMTVTQNVDGSLTLSNLFRGRRGTEVFTGDHAVGDSFVLLTTNDVIPFKVALADVGADRFYKGVSDKSSLEVTKAIKYKTEGRSLKPYAPTAVTATISGSDIALGWIRRTRLGGELKDLTGTVPLSESFESYEVDVFNAAGDTVLRTLRVDFGPTPVTSPGATYLAADIAADFGTMPSTLTVAVYQISGAVGRGFGRKQTLEVV